jgi:hypothetical protein
MSLFQNIVLKKYLAADSDKIADAYIRFAECFFYLEIPKIFISLCQQDKRERCLIDATTTRCILTTQIATTDQQIDRMVYALYGLTDEETKIIKNN